MNILHEISSYCDRTNTPVSRFGREAVRDPRLVGDLRRGRNPSPRTVARIRAFIAGAQQ